MTESPLRSVTPRSHAGITGALSSRPLSYGSSYAGSGVTGISSPSMRARLFAQREGSVLSEDMQASERESRWDTSLHLVQRQQPWSSASTGTQVAWQTHTSYDRLNWNLEPHPPWIAKAPGTYASTFERNLSYDPPTRSLPFRPLTADWDHRFLVANALSRDPVLNGRRKGLNNRRGTTCGNLSPTRSFQER